MERKSGQRSLEFVGEGFLHDERRKRPDREMGEGTWRKDVVEGKQRGLTILYSSRLIRQDEVAVIEQGSTFACVPHLLVLH
jgi:hypothetical protein